MGKKAKVGKARRDKFYQLAKETGYRSRAAFKLLQLNRKFEFLQTSRVLVDLCAAPGGWAQVAVQHMPVSSVVIAIDLVPIKAIHGVTALQEDITTDKCRQALKKELQTWKADVFLNDGAPNVGKNWLHDAFQQIQLTLEALKLATQFLRKGGWFISKVFRSKDYHALLWVFNQLFKNVHATKPQASRNESAEMFVVCKGYLAPDRLDPKFLDPKYVFKDVETAEPRKLLNLIHPEKRKRRAEGYTEGDYTLHHSLSATDFVNAHNHMELLADASEIVLDNDTVANHELTTEEIKECFRDIKVLGKKELRKIISWRKQIKTELDSAGLKEKEKQIEESSGSDEDEDEKLQQQLAELADEERRELKQKRKKVLREKRKLRDKMALNMVIPGDHIDQTDDTNLFDLKQVNTRQDFSNVPLEEWTASDSDDEDEDDMPHKKSKLTYERHSNVDLDDLEDDEAGQEWYSDDDKGSGDGDDSDDDQEEMDEDESGNPLVVQLEKSDDKVQRKMNMWFNKDIFSGLEGEAEEDFEIEKMKQSHKEKGGVILEKARKVKQTKPSARKETDSDSGQVSDADAEAGPDRGDQPANIEENDSEDDSVSDDSDYDFNMHQNLQRKIAESRQVDTASKATKTQKQKDGFEIVPAHAPALKKVKLGPVELAIGAEMIKSTKRKRELIEHSFNRYTFNDEGLPEWFVADEAKHNRVQLPVTREQIQEQKERMAAINVRPIKKVAEAKARKKRKSMKKLEKVRKKAEAISDTMDVSDKEKWQQIKQLYKKAGLLKNMKPNVAYVVAKKGAGKKVRRPAGVKGPFKVVDARLKKDRRNVKSREKNNRNGMKKGCRR